jgi:hypothetical protein
MVSSRDHRCPCASLIEKVEYYYCTTISWIILACVVVKQNSVSPTSCNSEILIIQHFWIVVQIPKVLLFCQKKLHWWNRQILGTSSKALPSVTIYQSLCYLLTSCLLFHQLLQLWRLQKTQEGTLMTVSRWRKYPNGLLLWLVVQHKCRSSSKNCL